MQTGFLMHAPFSSLFSLGRYPACTPFYDGRSDLSDRSDARTERIHKLCALRLWNMSRKRHGRMMKWAINWNGRMKMYMASEDAWQPHLLQPFCSYQQMKMKEAEQLWGKMSILRTCCLQHVQDCYSNQCCSHC